MALLGALAMGGAAKAACPAATPAQIAGVVSAMYARVAAGDEAGARAFMTPDFVLFENGVRMDAGQILGLMKTMRDQGKVYAWSVTEPSVHLLCDNAWIAYVNQGSMTDRDGLHPLTWLESANLHYDGRAWRLEFMHSTRAPAAK